MKNKKVAAVGVSLSETYALSEQYPLSETSARPASHLSLLTLSAPDTLSQNSLTRAQRKNGTKRAFKDKKPLKAEVGEKQGYA